MEHPRRAPVGNDERGGKNQSLLEVPLQFKQRVFSESRIPCHFSFRKSSVSVQFCPSLG